MAPVFSWTGFYIGGNIGAVWANNTWNDNLFGLSFDNGHKARLIIGGEAGFNYQMGNFVVGIEGDFDWANNYNISTVPCGRQAVLSVLHAKAGRLCISGTEAHSRMFASKPRRSPLLREQVSA